MAADLERLEDEFRKAMAFDGERAAEDMRSLFAAGGKRVRPALVLLFAKLGDYHFEQAKHAAMAVEFIHASTLVHDDVIDRSPLRRGMPTVAAARGAETAILVGDYYFAKAYAEAAATGLPEVVGSLAAAVMQVCLGELEARDDLRDYQRSVERYIRHVTSKTGALMSAACLMGALAGKVDEEPAGAYGALLGQAFQIVDDVLDYTGEADELGKPVGQDLREGSITLPLLEALQSEGERLRPLLARGTPLDDPTVAAVVGIVRESAGPAKALAKARRAASAAVRSLARLPAGEARETLARLATYVVERKL